ncbi:MAG: hypothetical protein JSV65_03790 [Armatimonadota bacterium]|nr:MAG: hypothetical protein JSV65_03790 [Armatimonadota bacterium]
MPRFAGVVVPGYPYHVTHRGNRREDVFFTPQEMRAVTYLRSKAGKDSNVPRVMLLLIPLALSLPLGDSASAPKLAEGHAKLGVWVYPQEVVFPANEAWRGTVTVGVRNLRDSGGAVFVRRHLWASAPGFGAQGPFAVRAEDSQGRRLEYTGPLARLAAIGADSFVVLAPRYCYGNEISLVPLFEGLRSPGTYRLWFRYVNTELPAALPRDRVFVGETAERVCSVHVQEP